MQIELKKLKIRKKNSGGRNSKGFITARHIGPSCKKKISLISFRKYLDIQRGIVVGFETDSKSNRNCPIALVYIRNLGIFMHILAESTLKIWDNVEFSRSFDKEWSAKVGSTYNLYDFDMNSRVFNIELSINRGGQLARSAGTYCRVLRRYYDPYLKRSLVQLELPSDKALYVSGACSAIFGTAGNKKYKYEKYKRAGQIRRLGYRPKVRGVAMNPVDHPHGGGEGKTSGGRVSVTPWGWKTKGIKTSSFRAKKRLKLIRKTLYLYNN